MEHKNDSLEDHSLIERLKSPQTEEIADASVNNEGEETLSGKSSPDSGCAICLGKLENKSFTDSCFHTFCFTCLLEWSKVKAECPLCKQPFKSIVHNVRSIEDYDQYYINVRATESTWQSPDGRRFRYSTTLTAERRRHRAFEESLEYHSHRLTYAPHTFSGSRSRDLGTDHHPSTSNFRRHIYENALWIQQDESLNRRYRDTSPEFFCQNPACTHRLIPWLNRELIALLHDSESQVIFVLELILALIMRYDIKSPEFYVHIEPYLQTRTTHFIHEFYNFARSPYDIANYDRRGVYEQLETRTNNEAQSSVSSSTSDIIVLPSNSHSDDGSNNKPDSTSTYQARKQIKHTRHNDFENSQHSSTHSNPDSVSKQILWNSDESWLDERELSQSISYASPCSLQDLESGLPGPSSSTCHQTSENSPAQQKKEKSSDNDGDSDCIIIGYVKPRAERTPELIDLVSNSSDEGETEKGNVVCRIKKSLLTEVDDKSLVKKKVRRFNRSKFYEWKNSQCANEPGSSRSEKRHRIKYPQWSSSDSSSKYSKHSGESSRNKSKSHRLSKRRSQKQSDNRSHASSTDTLVSDSGEESAGTDYSKDSTMRICRVVGKSSTVKFYKILSENSSSSSRKKHKRQKKRKHRKHKHHHKHRHHSSSSERV